MSSRSRLPAIWVTRPVPANQTTANTLGRSGFPVLAFPVLEIRFVSPDPVSTPPWPRWLIFVSAHAVEGLERVLAASGRTRPPAGTVRVAAVGRRTAQRARSGDWEVDLVPDQETAESLLQTMKETDLAGGSVWIPSGNRAGSATGLLPEGLRKAGAKVEVFRVYETLDRALLAEELHDLDLAIPGAVIVHSPSSAEALFSSREPAIVSWRTQAPMVSVGPSTTGRLRELDAGKIVECRTPSDQGIIEALSPIMSTQLKGKDR